jgi:hypothetical protein
VRIVVKIRQELDAFGLKMALAAVLLLSSVSCGFSPPTAQPMLTPPSSCPSRSQAPVSLEQPGQIASASQDVMNHLNYSINRSQYQHTSRKAGDVVLKVRCGHNYPFADGGTNKTYTITSDRDNSSNCPNATCWVIHVESVYNPGNIPTVSDVWVDQATMRWMTRHRIDKNIVSAGDMSIETIDRAVFD